MGLNSAVEEGPSHYIIVQLRSLSLEFFTERATRAASVKASLTPRFFIAEHSGELLVGTSLPYLLKSLFGRSVEC